MFLSRLEFYGFVSFSIECPRDGIISHSAYQDQSHIILVPLVRGIALSAFVGSLDTYSKFGHAQIHTPLGLLGL